MFLQTILHKKIRNNIKNYINLYNNYLKIDSLVLDIGCGNGMQAKVLKKTYPKLTIHGLDIKNCLWKENRDIPFKVYNGEIIPFRDNSFDVSLLSFVLHHAENPNKVLLESIRVSKNFVLIFEEIYLNLWQKWLLILYDIVINFLIFGEKISVPKFRKKEEWLKTFTAIGITKPVKIILIKSILPPFNRIFFVLTK